MSIFTDFISIEDIQTEVKQQVLEFVAHHPDAGGGAPPPNTTGGGSSWVVDHEAALGLILLHSKVNRWLQPGGHADGDGLLQMVALREAIEETGISGLKVWEDPIDIDVHVIEKRSSLDPAHIHL
jgi:hypothetical protein